MMKSQIDKRQRMKDKPVILVVDDQPQNIELLEAYLVPQGYEIVRAANGEEALGKLSGNQIDLILLDVMMPGMDGFEVTRRVRQDNTHRLLPIILVTILRETEDRVKGIEAGCDDFISTPVDKMELLARVQSLLKVKDYNDLMSNYRKELESEVTKRTEELKHAFENLQQDITKRKQAEEALVFNNIILRTQQESSIDGILVVDEKGVILSFNQRFVNMWSIPPDVIESKSDERTLQSVMDKLASPEEFIRKVKHLYEVRDEICRDEVVLKDGRVFDRYSAPMLGADGNYYGRVWYFRDITERKQSDKKLEQRTNAVEASVDGIAILNEDQKYVYINKAHARIYGYDTADELIGKSWCVLYDEDELQRFDHDIMPEFSQKGQWRGEATGKKKDGSAFFQEVSLTALDDGGLICIVRDTTKHKRVEEALRESEDKFRTIFDSASDGILLADPITNKFLQGNTAICSMLGYTKEEMANLTIYDIHPPEDIPHVFDEFEKQLKKEIVLAKDLPVLRKDGSIFYADVGSTPVTIGGMHYLVGIFRDITVRKQAEEELKRAAEKLRKGLVGTIHAMSLMVETRDPYTAGHQKRVSNLARVIAQEMGLPNDTVDTIRMAGTIHDIGKIAVPAEILSKPTKLTAIEFSLIKVHPQSGYDILKDVGLPYPIAEMVYQHHERLDGSGYPQGLKDGQILLEACILAVADVVEAMASHRPYRPAKGIDAALEEIEKNKSIFYDTRAVEACLRVFREKEFTFEATA